VTSLAPLVEKFFTQRLIEQRSASSNTVASYRDTFRLLLKFAASRLGRDPYQLNLGDLDAELIIAFLGHLERARGNSVRTRNARLSAIHSFFRYASFEDPAHAALIQRVMAIPHKRAEHGPIAFLTEDEVEAVLRAPDLNTVLGRRDHAILLLAIQTGLRVSEITHLRWHDVHLDAGAHVRCLGKGRKRRITPLTSTTIEALRSRQRELDLNPEDFVFPNRRGEPLSRDAIERLISKHVKAALPKCPTLENKTISPHTLRHTSAMRLLTAGVDRSVIALWLGHESVTTTEVYVHADMTLKERALERAGELATRSGRYRPPDRLLAFLESL
jgi:integrase/recombinase XerD